MLHHRASRGLAYHLARAPAPPPPSRDGHRYCGRSSLRPGEPLGRPGRRKGRLRDGRVFRPPAGGWDVHCARCRGRDRLGRRRRDAFRSFGGYSLKTEGGVAFDLSSGAGLLNSDQTLAVPLAAGGAKRPVGHHAHWPSTAEPSAAEIVSHHRLDSGCGHGAAPAQGAKAMSRPTSTVDMSTLTPAARRQLPP